MRELAIVAAITAVMCVLSSLWLTPWESLYYAGIWVTVAGFVLGVPTGFIYHVRLYQPAAHRISFAGDHDTG